MANDPAQPPRRASRIIRIIRARPRLFVSALSGLIVVAILLGAMWVPTRLLVGSDVGVALYLIAVYQLVASGDEKRMRRCWRSP